MTDKVDSGVRVCPDTGLEFEVVWSPAMKISLTGERLSRPNPVFDSPRETSTRPKSFTPKEIEDGKVTADSVRSGKRSYNKTGKHGTDPNYWKVEHEDE